MFWAEETARVKVEAEETWHVPEAAAGPARRQWGLWSVVKLKSQESDQTGPL